jgi:heme-degrading monooxygenase HmoA
MSCSILWEFHVPAVHRDRFEQAYAKDGAWARLFELGDGFLGTSLLRDGERDGVYLTVDRWVSMAAFDRFQQRFAARYAALDGELEGLATSETRLGVYEEVDP